MPNKISMQDLKVAIRFCHSIFQNPIEINKFLVKMTEDVDGIFHNDIMSVISRTFCPAVHIGNVRKSVWKDWIEVCKDKFIETEGQDNFAMMFHGLVDKETLEIDMSNWDYVNAFNKRLTQWKYETACLPNPSEIMDDESYISISRAVKNYPAVTDCIIEELEANPSFLSFILIELYNINIPSDISGNILEINKMALKESCKHRYEVQSYEHT